jgi:hypothetical protein
MRAAGTRSSSTGESARNAPVPSSPTRSTAAATCKKLAKLAPLNPAQLDDLVHERKGEEAAAIDNGGRVAQLVYLTGVRPDVAAQFLKAHGLEANGG